MVQINCHASETCYIYRCYNLAVLGVRSSQGTNTLGTVFRGNSVVVTYKDLVWFTLLSSLNLYDVASSSVRSLIIPPNVTTIQGDYAQSFPSCSDVSLHEGIVTIGRMAFRGFPSNLLLVIPSTVTHFGSELFYRLSSPKVVMLPTTPPSTDGSIFNYASNYKIYVPDASVNDYKASSYWSMYANSIYPMSDYAG